MKKVKKLRLNQKGKNMINKRKIFYRRKGKLIAIEGTRHKNKVFLMTLPKNPIDLILILEKGSFFKKGNFEKLWQKVQGLDLKQEEEVKQPS